MVTKSDKDFQTNVTSNLTLNTSTISSCASLPPPSSPSSTATTTDKIEAANENETGTNSNSTTSMASASETSEEVLSVVADGAAIRKPNTSSESSTQRTPAYEDAGICDSTEQNCSTSTTADAIKSPDDEIELKPIIDADDMPIITLSSGDCDSLPSAESLQADYDGTQKSSAQPHASFLRSHLQPRQSHSSFSINKNEEFEFEVPEEAPVFVPTEQEFKNPLTYISKIRPIAEKYGICKIRPPPTWQPPFTVDVDKLRFIPRVQRLNELEAKTRVKLNFLDQIAKFWELQGSSLKIPMVERKALDLYSLHRIVQEEGGLEQATNGRKWSKVASRMGYPVGKSVGTILKGHYERILYPFDVFTSGKGEEIKPKLETDSEDHDYKPHGIPSRQNITPPNESTARRSQRFIVKAENIKKLEEENCDEYPNDIKISKKVTPQKSISGNGDNKLNGSGSNASDVVASTARAELRRSQLFNLSPKMAGFKARPNQSPQHQQSQPQPQLTPTKSRMNGAGGGGGGSSGGASRQQRQTTNRRNHADPLAKYICHICTRGDGEEAMLLCDGCDDSYHTFCLIPPLADIPKGDWRCPKCVVEEVSKPVEAFGFEQAQREYTLQQFGEMADQFKADYFNIPVHLVPTELVEREFWRIVSSIDEDVAVEYGADLHTMDHGSGFPTKSSLYLLPGDLEYADSSWNLNNLPLLEESVLGHINADISGMKVPWMYVGMCFATFCWHNEDHWSYSINYLHWGEPKTWYGVPGNKAEAFENTMRSAAPELFQSQPDLLHQLVTIMNPNTLMNAGVPVYRTDQHAGEFIITFPRAYHAGFNQGYNFAEAVNFAPADWIKMGRECINHYSNLRRFCVFSHDELVCKMALDPDKLNLSIATACYLDMAEMVDTEKKLRKCLLEWGVTKAEREAFELIPDDERQCEVCKTTCFLSAVTCVCVKTLVCLRHYSELCKCSPEKHTLKYRYTLDELPLMLRKLKVKAESFETWITKVREVLDPTTPTTITLDELQQLSQEAEDKKFPSSVLLERLNSAVLEAEKCVTVIQQLDINKVRTRTRNSSCEIAKYKLTVEELDMFVQEIDNLCCIIKEGSSVRELQQIGKEFADLATYLLNEPINEIKETAVEKMIEEGSALCIELPQMKPLQALQEKLKWYNMVREFRESEEKMPLNTIKKYLDEGHALTIVGEVDDTLIQQELNELQSIMVDIEEWEADSKKCFESGTQHDIPEIEELLRRADTINGKIPSQQMLEDALKKAKEWLATVEILQANEHYPYFNTLENVVNRGKNIPFELEELKRMEEHLISAHVWKQKTSRTFLKRNSSLELMEVLSPRKSSVMLSSSFGSQTHNKSALSTHSSTNNHVDKKQFTEDMGPAHMVIAFKNAEEKEMSDMRELRQKSTNKNPEKSTYCTCHQSFYGLMYKCQLCLDWFHSACVRNYPNVNGQNSNAITPTSTPIKQNRNSSNASVASPVQTPLPNNALQTSGRARDREPKYLCESCQRSKRPRLETILTLLVSLQKLPIRLPEGEALQCLTERAMNWQDRARQVLDTAEVVNALATIQKHTNLDPKTGEGPLSLDSNEHTYSTVDSTTAAAVQTNQQISAAESSVQTTPSNAPKNTLANSCGTGAGPIIQLETSTKRKIDDLMMEGDLLEVSLDETQYLWRLYNASKADTTDLDYIRSKYNIKQPALTDTLVSNIRKRHSDEHHTDAIIKKSKVRTALASGNCHSNFINNIADDGDGDGDGDGDADQPLQSPDNDYSNVPNASATTATPTTTMTATMTTTSAGDISKASTKRGRKVALTAKEMDSQIMIIDENSSTSLHEVSNSTQSNKNNNPNNNNNKKKRRRKNQTNQSNPEANSKDDGRNLSTAASTSDEDEECSALNCIRPAGREVDWVQCDGGCNEWFHMLCVGLIKSQVKPDDDFICKKCKKTTGPNDATSTAAITTATTTTKMTTTTRSNRKPPATTVTTGVNTGSTKKRCVRNKDELNATETSTSDTKETVQENDDVSSKDKEIGSTDKNRSTKNDNQLESMTTSTPADSTTSSTAPQTPSKTATSTLSSSPTTTTSPVPAKRLTAEMKSPASTVQPTVPIKKKKNQQKS